ncbi:MAG: hypothetical protein ACI8PT_003510 [Gammaproteobacteria bacterium]|jgi:uncharacterized protein YcaQ
MVSGTVRGASHPELSIKQARRLAIVQAGLASTRSTGLPTRALGRGRRTLQAAHSLIEHFGYLQLDSVAVSGARTQSIVLGSRLNGFSADLGERLLRPGEPIFEYWGHEASWLPISLYPVFAFRRDEFAIHPWWGDVIGEHRAVADAITKRIAAEGPLRSLDFEGESRSGWGAGKLPQRVLEALWSAGHLVVSERVGFQRYFDLPERVIPQALAVAPLSTARAIECLLLRALDGHGWATTGTLAATWRLKNRGPAIKAALERLRENEDIVACDLLTPNARRDRVTGWIRPAKTDLAQRLAKARWRVDKGVLLSPFDPLLWDRARVQTLFGFEQRIEIYKPKDQRQFGYYCLPVLAGDALVGRVDLKAHRARGVVEVLSRHFEREHTSAHEAMASALTRFSTFVGLRLEDHSR